MHKEENMKIYLIKSSDALLLNGLSGLHRGPNNNNYTPILVNDDAYDLNKLAGRLTSLPKSCDPRLVCSILKKMQLGQASFESIQQLQRYLQCAEKKDREGKSTFVKGIEKFFFGLLYVMSAGGGFLLMTLLMGLFPVYTPWISLLVIPIIAVAAYGIINSLIGVFQCGLGIFSCCCRPKAADNNAEQLQMLEAALYRSLQSGSLASYHEQAVRPCIGKASSNIPLQQAFSSEYTPHFYCSYDASDNRVNENSPPPYHYCR